MCSIILIIAACVSDELTSVSKMPFCSCKIISSAPSFGVAMMAHSQYIASRSEVDRPPPGKEE